MKICEFSDRRGFFIIYTKPTKNVLKKQKLYEKWREDYETKGKKTGNICFERDIADGFFDSLRRKAA